jgi:hypothetical protein
VKREDTISRGKCVLDGEMWKSPAALLNKSMGGIIEDYPGFIMIDSAARQNTD